MFLSCFIGVLSDASQAPEPAKEERHEDAVSETSEMSSLVLVLQTAEDEDEEEVLPGSLVLFHPPVAH